MTDFHLGQRVAYTEHLRRRNARSGEFNGPHKLWSNTSGPGMETFRGGEGIIVGKRTLSNGKNDWGPDEGTTYYPFEHFAAYVVAYDLHRKPVHVLPEHITSLEEVAA